MIIKRIYSDLLVLHIIESQSVLIVDVLTLMPSDLP